MYSPELVEAKYIRNYTIWVRFSDSTAGEVDLENELYGEIFAPLKDVETFKCFSIHPELKTLIWSNGADFAPEFIYQSVKKAA